MECNIINTCRISKRYPIIYFFSCLRWKKYWFIYWPCNFFFHNCYHLFRCKFTNANYTFHTIVCTFEVWTWSLRSVQTLHWLFPFVLCIGNLLDTILPDDWTKSTIVNSQGSKLTLVRDSWPVVLLSGKWNLLSTDHWPGWPLKFWNPTSEFTWLSANLSYRL